MRLVVHEGEGAAYADSLGVVAVADSIAEGDAHVVVVAIAVVAFAVDSSDQVVLFA